MAKHVFIKIYDDDRVEILDENQKIIPETARDATIKTGKKVGQAFWWNENPTCVWYNGKQY